MKYVLSKTQRPLLRALFHQQTLFAFDFDGTLAPIVRDPAKAAMRLVTHRLLQRLASLQPVAIISGRSRSDILSRTKGIRPLVVVGNHGIEHTDGLPHAQVDGWAASR